MTTDIAVQIEKKKCTEHGLEGARSKVVHVLAISEIVLRFCGQFGMNAYRNKSYF